MAKKKRPAAAKEDGEQGPLQLPDRRAMEKMLQQLASGFESEQRPDTPLDQAQELMYQAFEASDTERVRLARRALKISADCADAYALLAEHAKTAEEAMTLYKQGVDAGERAIGPEAFEEYEGHFWGFLETRPYMRARQGLAQCLRETGRCEEAAEHYWDMLRLNPGDNQGVRYSLTTLLLDLERDDELTRLLAQYEDDGSAEWVYAKVLLAFRKGGESVQAAKLLKQALKVNKHVPGYLVGQKQLPHAMPSYITMGGEDEAISYTAGNRRAWLNTPGAISWLRKTLKLPVSGGPKPRRPSWSQLKMALKGCPQEQGEVWQVDVMPSPVDGRSDPKEEAPWVALMVGRIGQELLGLDVFDSEPSPSELWDYVTNAMWKPRDREPRRPAMIEVRQKAFHAAWKAKLKQIGVECALSDTLDAFDQLWNSLPSAIPQIAERGTDPVANSDDILSLPIEPGEVWQADVRLLPTWITGEGAPYRPWISLVVNRTDDLVLGHQVMMERPHVDWLWESILQAIRQPGMGEPHRPGAIEVATLEQAKALKSYLDQAGIACVALERLEHIESAFDSMTEHFAGQDAPPSIIDVPGVTPEQVASFYAAAAEFYRRKPWLRVPGDAIIQIERDKLPSNPWYAIVMGQSGVQQGLAIYEDLAALQALIAGNASEEKKVRGMSAISMMYSEAFEISTRDLDAIEKHGWPVAGPEAYPMVIHINPGLAMRSLLTWELELLEGCLQTIPDFLSEKNTSATKSVQLASGASTLRLSRVPNNRR